MKNKKGFTIVEILTVVIIIGLILLVTIPTVKLISNSIKQRIYEAKITSIEKAAEEYAKNNRDQFGNATQIQVTVKTLLNYGYLKIDVLSENENCDDSLGCIINPMDNVSMNDESVSIKRNMSIYQAKFGEEIKEDILVYFESNGASFIGADVLSCKDGDEITLPEITRDGYEILGWVYNDPNGTVANYVVGDPLVLDSNNAGGTYYAVTSKTLTATFNGNGTDTATSVQTCAMYNTGTSCQITSPKITRSEWDIVGWGSSPTSTTSSLEASASKSITDNIAYYAITKKELNAYFNANGASSISKTSDTCSVYNAETSCSIVLPTISNSSAKITSIGWNTLASSTSSSYSNSIALTFSNTNTTYYAITKKECTGSAEYNCNASGGTLSGTNCIITTTTAAEKDDHTYWKCWDRDDTDRVYCTGTAGGSYALTCKDASYSKSKGCNTAIGYYYCRYRCTSDYVCNGAVTSSSTCTTTSTVAATASCTASGATRSGTTCTVYKYNTDTCPSGYSS